MTNTWGQLFWRNREWIAQYVYTIYTLDNKITHRVQYLVPRLYAVLRNKLDWSIPLHGRRLRTETGPLSMRPPWGQNQKAMWSELGYLSVRYVLGQLLNCYVVRDPRSRIPDIAHLNFVQNGSVQFNGKSWPVRSCRSGLQSDRPLKGPRTETYEFFMLI